MTSLFNSRTLALLASNVSDEKQQGSVFAHLKSWDLLGYLDFLFFFKTN